MTAMKGFEGILVATDLSEMSAPLCILAERLARQSATKLVIAHIASPEGYVEVVGTVAERVPATMSGGR